MLLDDLIAAGLEDGEESPAPAVRLEALGGVRLWIGETEVAADAERLFASLLVLVLGDGREVERDRLATLVWPDASPVLARQSARQMAYRLRKLGVPLEATAATLRLRSEAVRMDCIVPATDLLAASPASTARFYARPLLAGYEPAWSAPLRAYVDESRGRLGARLRRQLFASLVAARQAGRWDAVEALGQGVLVHDPLNEEATLAVAEAMALTGSKHRALELLDRYLADIDDRVPDLRVAPGVLRRRIAERLPMTTHEEREGTFVGRDEEMGRLLHLLQAARQGRGSAVLLEGDAGIGKTRLLKELARAAAVMGYQVVVHAPTNIEHLQPLSTLSRIAALALELEGALGASPASVSILRELQSTNPHARDSQGLNAIAHAVMDVLDAATQEKTTLVCLDDAHRSDRTSLELLAALCRSAQQSRAVFVLASRLDVPEMSASSLIRNRLGPLAHRPTKRIAEERAIWAEHPLTDTQVEECAKLSGGHPLFALELVAHCGAFPSRHIPRLSLSRLIDTRLASLAPDSLQLLQTLAVLGSFCTLARIQRLHSVPPQSLVRDFADLDARGLIAGSSQQPSVRHDLIAEHALGMMPPVARSVLHRFAAESLSDECRDNPTVPIVVAIAVHWIEAGLPDEAVAAISSSLSKLQQANQPAALPSLLLPAAKAVREGASAGSLLEELGHAAVSTGRIQPLWDAINILAPDTRDPTSDSRLRPFGSTVIRAVQLSTLNWSGALERAVTHSRKTDIPRDERVSAALYGLMGADNSGDRERARAIWNEIRGPSLRPHLTPTEWLRAQIVYHTHLGDLDVAVSAAQEHLNVCSASVQAIERFLGYYYLAHPAFLSGAIDVSKDCLVKAVDIAESANIPTRELSAIYRLLDLAIYRGDKDSAKPLLSRLASLLPLNEDIDNRRAAAAFALRCRMHLGLNPPAALPATLEFAVITSNPVFRSRTQDVSTVVLHAATKAHRLAPRAVSILRQDIQQYGDQGMMDYPVAALITYEVAKGRVDQARQIAHSYLTKQRRERGPLHFVLRIALDSLKRPEQA